MKANDYQKFTKETAIFPKQDSLTYLTLGLTGEAGELANKVKKIIRDNNGVLTDEIQEQLISELGDVMWYSAQLAEFLGTTLENVFDKNAFKLLDRQKRNKLQGSGDVR